MAKESTQGAKEYILGDMWELPAPRIISDSRYRHILHELKRLLDRYGDDLDHVIPFLNLNIKKVLDEAEKLRHSKGGRPKIWTTSRRMKVWMMVELVRRMYRMNVGQACARLSKEGFSTDAFVRSSNRPPRAAERPLKSEALKKQYGLAAKILSKFPEQKERLRKLTKQVEESMRAQGIATLRHTNESVHMVELTTSMEMIEVVAKIQRNLGQEIDS